MKYHSFIINDKNIFLPIFKNFFKMHVNVMLEQFKESKRSEPVKKKKMSNKNLFSSFFYSTLYPLKTKLNNNNKFFLKKKN